MLLFGKDERGPDEDLMMQFEAITCFNEEQKRVVRSLLEGMILRHEGGAGNGCRTAAKKGTEMSETRDHVHALIDHLPPGKLAAVETLLESMLDPLSRKLALASVDDEPFTNEQRQAVAEAIEWSGQNAPIPLEDVLADLGLTMADWDAMGRTQLPQEQNGGNG